MRHIYIIVCVASLALSMCQKVAAADAKTTAEALWAEGIAAYEAKDFEAAVDKFEHIIHIIAIITSIVVSFKSSKFIVALSNFN